jgi:hypothetical protein
VKLSFDTKNKGTMVCENEHEVCIYEDMFEVGFRFPFLRVVKEDAPLSSDSSLSTGSECMVNLLYLCNSLAEGPWRGTRTLGSRVSEDIQTIEESQVRVYF